MSHFDNLEQALENLTKRGAFFTTTNGKEVNTMTITWGYVGYCFNKPYFIAMIRPQRHTFSLLKDADSFTVSIPFSEEFKKALSVCGTTTGKEVNKETLANIKFIDSKEVDAPVVSGCDKYYECSLKFVEEVKKETFPTFLKEMYYKNDDFHYLFFGEIVESY